MGSEADSLLSCDRLLIIDFNCEAEILDHSPNFRRWCARRGQIAVHENRVGWVEGQRLEAAEIVFAAAGDADFCTRVKEAEEAQDFQASLRREVVAVLQRRACHGMQRV